MIWRQKMSRARLEAMTNQNDDFELALSEQIDAVFRGHPNLFDHRKKFPWLTGSLGDPSADVFFVAENPSLSQVERAIDPTGGPPTKEAQWYASKADKLFREALIAAGFKDGKVASLGGWKCYITNVIKEADYAGRWNQSDQQRHDDAADIWSGVLGWELETVKPKLVVAMGNKVERHLTRLDKAGKINLPALMKIDHYSYVAFRPRGKLGPMHPDRVRDYLESIRRVSLRLN